MTGLRVAAVAAVLVACVTPRGPYGQNPDELWALKVESPAVLPVLSYAGPPIVLRRFEDTSRSPVGGHYGVGWQGESLAEKAEETTVPVESLARIYSPVADLGTPLFEATFRALKAAGYPVWSDYLAGSQDILGPPGTPDFRVVTGVVTDVELDTFGATDVHQAGRVRVLFRELGPDGRELRHWETVERVRMGLGAGDVLAGLGQRLARGLAVTMNQGGLQ